MKRLRKNNSDLQGLVDNNTAANEFNSSQNILLDDIFRSSSNLLNNKSDDFELTVSKSLSLPIIASLRLNSFRKDYSKFNMREFQNTIPEEDEDELPKYEVQNEKKKGTAF